MVRNAWPPQNHGGLPLHRPLVFELGPEVEPVVMVDARGEGAVWTKEGEVRTGGGVAQGAGAGVEDSDLDAHGD